MDVIGVDRRPMVLLLVNTMQDDTGLKAIFKLPSLYSFGQKLIGATAAREWFIRECLRVRPNDKLVDIGCGPGDILLALPEVEYVGLDISEAYIRKAEGRFGLRGLFLVGTVDTCRGDQRLCNADLVFCVGVLHHLHDDEARRLLSFARENLKPGGRFVGLEPTFLAWQKPLSRWIMSKDRGQNIRQEEAWKALLAEEFPDFTTRVLTGLIRIPYTHIVLEGHKK